MKLLSYLLFFLAVLLGVGAVVGGIYVCVYQGWFLGIVGCIEAGKATPIDSAKLAWSLIRVLLGSAMGWLTCWGGWALAAFTFTAANSCNNQARRVARAEKDRRERLLVARRMEGLGNQALDELLRRKP